MTETTLTLYISKMSSRNVVSETIPLHEVLNVFIDDVHNVSKEEGNHETHKVGEEPIKDSALVVQTDPYGSTFGYAKNPQSLL
jgi:hypothetical protein